MAAPKIRVAKSVIRALGRSLRVWFLAHRAFLKRIGLVLALIAFAGGFAWAWTSLSGRIDTIAWQPLVALMLIGVPATIVLNAAELRAMASAAGRPMRWPRALEVTVYASAGNMLPLPGGIIARLGGLKAEGVATRASAWLIGLFAGVWGGMSMLVSGVAVLAASPVAGSALLAAGALLYAGSAWGILRRDYGWSMLGRVSIIRFALLVLDCARMVLAIAALGASLSPMAAAAFSVTSFAGTAVSLVPAGLGVREWVAASIAPLVGIGPAFGFLAAALNRLFGMAGLSILTGLLLWRDSRARSRRSAAASPPTASVDA
ncbi:hypothetical protein [Jiella marina]|uniref:hypothetical protein n=1 Tax=Jiella sp. LLJ827 TaxID=2917712 RepID=UPI0021006A69|nr:hypothetical protein [Jiella sp. LLJ827]MCQ0987654.1 hypothetical protein [Jiella sp. LLJ827]